MNEEERQMLNAYHAQVYEKIGSYLTEEEQIWLKKATRPI